MHRTPIFLRWSDQEKLNEYRDIELLELPFLQALSRSPQSQAEPSPSVRTKQGSVPVLRSKLADIDNSGSIEKAQSSVPVLRSKQADIDNSGSIDTAVNSFAAVNFLLLPLFLLQGSVPVLRSKEADIDNSGSEDTVNSLATSIN
ncbi:hypothetical protein NE237_030723 [Protea cynaroides]|uniref:Uncharacterized protein n=1 Tax=Protea cynaroides TaxID=273540 RepID=A0A9Q0GVK6_9MAGN|nr:hypothetical protein NE237_030723 [Protea cynaroides]